MSASHPIAVISYRPRGAYSQSGSLKVSISNRSRARMRANPLISLMKHPALAAIRFSPMDCVSCVPFRACQALSESALFHRAHRPFNSPTLRPPIAAQARPLGLGAIHETSASLPIVRGSAPKFARRNPAHPGQSRPPGKPRLMCQC